MNKIVFITASSDGLGYQIAIDLALKGYIIILNGRDANKLQEAKRKLHNEKLHFTFCCDLVSDTMINELNNFIITNNIYPDIIIHCLGGKLNNDSHLISLSTLSNSLNLNLFNAILINNYFIPIFQKTNSIQKIIHISSSASLNGNASPCYSISKGALNVYIKNCARFYALDNISFSGIIPNIIIHKHSDWAKKKVQDTSYYMKRINEMPLKEFATPEKISPYICALCDIDNMYNTGSLIELQGGI